MAVGPVIGVTFTGNDLEQTFGNLWEDFNRAIWALHGFCQAKSDLLGNGGGALAALPRTVNGSSQPFNADEIFLIGTLRDKAEELFGIYTGTTTLGSPENYMQLASALFGSGR